MGITVYLLIHEESTDITASNIFFSGKVVSLYSRFDVIVSTMSHSLLSLHIIALFAAQTLLYLFFATESSSPEDLQQSGHAYAGGRSQALVFC